MVRRPHDLYEARAGLPRPTGRGSLREWLRAPAADLASPGAMEGLLACAERYERVCDMFNPEGIVSAARGMTGLLRSNGTARLLFGIPWLGHGREWSNEDDRGATTGGMIDFLSSVSGEVAEAVDLIAYLLHRGRISIGMAVVAESQGRSLDMSAYGNPHRGWAMVCDGAERALLAVDAGGRPTLVPGGPAVRAAEDAFAALWYSNAPRPYTDDLPPHVLQSLRRRGERVVHPREPGAPPPDRVRRRSYTPAECLRMAILRDAPMMPGGRFVGIESAPVEPWPHQLAVARRVVADHPRSWLLADEVGLGKTIETGLVLRALTLSGIVGRTLVSAPASLCGQWEREMRSKFLLGFDVATGAAKADAYESDRLIVSRNLLASTSVTRRASLGAAADWDMVVVDEAHNARKGTEFGEVLSDVMRPRCDSLLLASATPMQMHPGEAFDLARMLRRGGTFAGDDVLAEEYYAALDSLARCRKGDGDGHAMTPRHLQVLRDALREYREVDPSDWARLWSELEMRNGERQADAFLAFVEGRDDLPERGRTGFLNICYAIAPLSRAMQRHGRAILRLYEDHDLLGGQHLPERVVVAQSVPFDPMGRAFVDALGEYTTELSRRLSGKGRRASRGASFYASFVRLRAASSDTAIGRTLSRRLARVEATLASKLASEARLVEMQEAVLGVDEDGGDAADGLLLRDREREDLEWELGRLRHLSGMLGAAGAKMAAKASRLVATMRMRAGGPLGSEQSVVFTRFRDTVDEIVTVLSRELPGLRVGTYTGRGGAMRRAGAAGLQPADRDEVKASFLAGLLDVLVCTDAAAEGLNLQTADLLVNYDLPWNPAKVEQRIGRIDRIGQVHPQVTVVNMVYQGSAEERVYARLLERLDQATTLVGSQQLSLIPLDEADFLLLASEEVPEARKEELIVRAQASALKAAQRASAREMPIKALFSRYWREADREATRRVPARLGDLWQALASSGTLASLGFETASDGVGLDLPLLDGETRRIRLTVDREAFDRGGSPDGPRLAFATWGSPVVESIFRLFSERGLPPCARRLETRVRVGRRDVPMVGYGVVTDAGPRLVTSVDDLWAMEPDLSATLSDTDAARLTETLAGLAAEEFAAAVDVANVERRSEAVTMARHALTSAVAQVLLAQRVATGDRRPFEQDAQAVEARLDAMGDGMTTLTAVVDAHLVASMPGLFEVLASDARRAKVRLRADAHLVRSGLARAREVYATLRKGKGFRTEDVLQGLRMRHRELHGVAEAA